MARMSFTAGRRHRRAVRFKAAALGLTCREFKGLFKSGFVIEGDGDGVAEFSKWLMVRWKNMARLGRMNEIG